jgi:hypothetical protein
MSVPPTILGAMATRTHQHRRGRPRPRSGRPVIDQAHDPFAGTVLDYIYNMATAELLTAEMLSHYGGSRNLITRLVARELHTSEDRLRDPDGDYGKALDKALKTMFARLDGKRRKPKPPREPVPSNLATIARLLPPGLRRRRDANLAVRHHLPAQRHEGGA